MVSLIGSSINHNDDNDKDEKIIKETGLISPKGNERGAHFLTDCFLLSLVVILMEGQCNRLFNLYVSHDFNFVRNSRRVSELFLPIDHLTTGVRRQLFLRKG